ncbi:MAG: asparagine synthase (glutamine-hydrolyzing), partial [Planctomycetota bacterium]
IIDIQHGSQPLYYGFKDKKYVIVFNGEIYNYLELKEKLIQEGFLFHTDSDTEVLLAAYCKWKQELLRYLNGMFAFAIYDPQQEILFLARDPLGQKPLYYAVQKDSILFASEPKAIISYPQWTPKISPFSLLKFFFFDFIPGQDSIFEGIFKLLPGHCMTIQLQNLSFAIKKYFEISFHPSTSITIQEAVPALRAKLQESVQRHLISHVPLGIFLSGGVDSTTILAIAQKISSSRLPTFSIGFEETGFDETPYIQEVVKYYHCQHSHFLFSPTQFKETFKEMLSFMDEPFGDPAFLPTFFLAKQSVPSIKVALGGEGSDELFAGYFPFLAMYPANLCQNFIPPPLLRGLQKLISLLPHKDAYFSLDFKIRRFLQGLTQKAPLRLPFWMTSAPPPRLASILKRDFWSLPLWKALEEEMERIFQNLNLNEIKGVEGCFHYFLKVYLPHDILYKFDRAAMYHSLEGRSPFLDKELIDFALQLPPTLKFRNFILKFILKEAVKPWLPQKIFTRPKQGFGVPLFKWMKGPLKKWMIHSLKAITHNQSQPFFDSKAVQKIVSETLEGKRDHSRILYNLILFSGFYSQWFQKEKLEDDCFL